MKKVPLKLLIISIVLALPVSILLTWKLSAVFPENVLTISYKSENAIIPEIFYQKKLSGSYTQEKLVSRHTFDSKTGFATGKIRISKRKFAVLRLDFGSNPGKVEVKKLTFRSRDIPKEVLLKSNFQNMGGIQFPKNSLVTFHSYQADPYVIFPLVLCNVYPFNFWYLLLTFVISSAVFFSVLLRQAKWANSRKASAEEAA